MCSEREYAHHEQVLEQVRQRHGDALRQEVEGVLFKMQQTICPSPVLNRDGSGGYTDTMSTSKQDALDREPSGIDRPQLMISYAWKQQEKVKSVYKELTDAKYEVWLDIHDMAKSGSGKGILEAMSDGIDRADVMLICVSKEYSKSSNCRLEAEYAHMQNKPILYLMMEEGYEKPVGWLGMLLGQKLWYNMFAGTMDEQMSNLLTAIVSHQ